MNRVMHPVEREEVMAYLDGELEAGHAAIVAAHLEQCAECKTLAGDLRAVSQRVAAWQVEPAPPRLTEQVRAALAETPPGQPDAGWAKGALGEPQRKRPFFLRPWVWQLAGGFAVLLAITALSIPNLLRSRMAADRASQMARERQALEGFANQDKESVAARSAGRASSRGEAGGAGYPQARRMLIRTASLVVVTREFENTRAAMEFVVRKHSGWVAQLSASGHPGGARSLTATLRVPADRLDAVLDELKKLGRVEGESQGSEEVTEQYVDLVARLANARHTEQRLVEVLRQRAGKVAEVLEVEREMARVRGEIERMEAQRKNLENQVQFATLTLRLQEEYKAQVDVPKPSTSTLLWNAAVDGYHALTESALGLAFAALRYGPALLFWCAVFFWPARYLWRRLRTPAAT